MIFTTQETLSEYELELFLKNVTKDGYISQVMDNLTSGPILIYGYRLPWQSRRSLKIKRKKVKSHKK